MQLVRPGGVVALDNVLWHGDVANPDRHDHQTLALRAAQREDPRRPAGEPVLLPIGDGLMLARRR